MQVIACKNCGRMLHNGPLPSTIGGLNAFLDTLYGGCPCRKDDKQKQKQQLEIEKNIQDLSDAGRR